MAKANVAVIEGVGGSAIFLEPEFPLFECSTCGETFDASWKSVFAQPARPGDPQQLWIDKMNQAHRRLSPRCPAGQKSFRQIIE